MQKNGFPEWQAETVQRELRRLRRHVAKLENGSVLRDVKSLLSAAEAAMNKHIKRLQRRTKV